eukprot:scaffold4513_cov39-Isochrysis_galbana.AAC.1
MARLSLPPPPTCIAQHGARPSQADQSGASALSIAAALAHNEALALLLAAGDGKKKKRGGWVVVRRGLR